MTNINTMKENEEYRLNEIYVSENERRTIWDAEFECKRASTALKRIAKELPNLDWILKCNPEENNNLSAEYDSYTLEIFDGTIYIAVCEYK